jgi:hypothetical protein
MVFFYFCLFYFLSFAHFIGFIVEMDWNGVHAILQHGLNCMQIDSSEYPILLADSCFPNLNDKAKVID